MPEVKIIQIADNAAKSLYTNQILRKLPDWFGNEAGICHYVETVLGLPFWCAKDADGDVIGFLAVKIHYNRTGDIYVCGILPEYHRRGIGRMMFDAADAYFRQMGCSYVVVKTLSDIAHDEPYDRTRLFYESVGFEKLLTLTEMWDEENPCLIMIKKL